MSTDKQLDHDTGRVVDLLLNHEVDGVLNGDGSSMSNSYRMSGPNMKSRLESVEHVLRLLSAMPAPEPPVELVGRTLQLIEDAGVAAPNPIQGTRSIRNAEARPQA